MSQPPAFAPTAPSIDQMRERVDKARRALDIAAAWLGQDAVADIRHDLERIDQRLALGIDSTVVALLGGTGSGKSSLFNAVSGLKFADVGVKRPTTQDATACVWGGDASALLDWLGVAPDRRIQRESELDAEDQAELRGLVLLDMPDHDSVVAEHRDKVDRVLPLADLLVWVVDPQKYADDALHSGYLATLHGHEGAMVVVLNQIDRVRRSAVDELVADLRRLLEHDGLDDLEILATSVVSGAGIAELRTRLSELVSQRTSAMVRAQVEFGDVMGRLQDVVGRGLPPDLGQAQALVASELADLAGAAAVVEKIESQEKVEALRVVDERGAERLLEHWLDALDLDAHLGAWRAAAQRALPPASDLRDRLNDVIARLGNSPDVNVEPRSRKGGARKAALRAREVLDAELGQAIGDVLLAPTEQALSGLAGARAAVAALSDQVARPAGTGE